jgi:hypothetical protein
MPEMILHDSSGSSHSLLSRPNDGEFDLQQYSFTYSWNEMG